jgi:hypothetical protein
MASPGMGGGNMDVWWELTRDYSGRRPAEVSLNLSKMGIIRPSH